MSTVYRYGGFYWSGDLDDGGWVALLGSTEYTRSDLSKMTVDHNSPEQMAEVEKALAELPTDMVLPTKAQRRKIIPAEGDLS